MSKPLMCSLLFAGVALCISAANAKDRPTRAPREFSTYRFHVPEQTTALPSALRPEGPARTATAIDTFVLAVFDFQSGGLADAEGWTSADLTGQLRNFFHVADGTELNGGAGALFPIEGQQSMWCGTPPSTADPFCSWFSLPGYGNNWDQHLVTGTLTGDSVRVSYKARWDAEPGYDATRFAYSGDGGATWIDFPVNGGDPVGYAFQGEAVETWTAGGLGSVDLRFRFTSDGAFSDADGLWPTDGAIILDSITVETFTGGVSNGVLFSDFESASPGDEGDGLWQAALAPAFGDFAALYPGVNLLQEDACYADYTSLWGFFDDPANTNYACHKPDPRPDVGVVPFGRDGLYMWNEIWSPMIPSVGAGDQFVLEFSIYGDLPLDNLVFYNYSMRSLVAGCASEWRHHDLFFLGPTPRGWVRIQTDVSTLVKPAGSHHQIALGVLDACGFWCGVFGTGNCHSHSPLYDDVRLLRVDRPGPSIFVRHIDLFQDNFAEDGTLTGTARADMARDILPGTNGSILPGDSIAVSIDDKVGTDPHTGAGPAAYVYLSVWPQGQAGKTAAHLQSLETRPGVGTRFPFVASTMHDGVTWYCFRMDSAVTQTLVLNDRYCFDMNDNVLTPGDTICYVLGAEAAGGDATYWTRELNGQGLNLVTDDLATALSTPLEFTILPAGGWARGGEILYVDDADDRAGPPQLYFDTAFDLWADTRGFVDRYDVMGPSSAVGNGLGSRVKNVAVQLQSTYRAIIWNTANLSSGLVGDGGTPNGGSGAEKSDDWQLLFEFVDTHLDNPGVYFSGDDLASEWAILTGAGAAGFRSTYMNFNLDPAGGAGDSDHRNALEPVSPLLTGVGPCVLGNKFVAYGGCPWLNDFDVLLPTGSSLAEFQNLASGRTYVLSQSTPNSAASTARVWLSGFSFHEIRDTGSPVTVPARATHLRNVMRCMLAGAPVTPTGNQPLSRLANDLGPASPNPFNPSTTIRYTIRDPGHVHLVIYNAAGQRVRTLVSEEQSPRPEGFSVEWDGRNDTGRVVSSGVYFYRLVAPGFTDTKKAVMLK